MGNTKKDGANGSDSGFCFSLGGTRIQGNVRSDGCHQIAEEGRMCISEGKDLVKESFGNQRFIVRWSTDSRWNENLDRNVSRPHRRLLIYSEMRGSRTAINSRI